VLVVAAAVQCGIEPTEDLSWGYGQNTQITGSPAEVVCPLAVAHSITSVDFIKSTLYHTCMDMFSALADPTRRAILEILANCGELTATDICGHFPVSPQAVSQHLKVLRETNLLVMDKRAQKHLYRLNPRTLSQFETWVQQTRQRWEERFAALDEVLVVEQQKRAQREHEQA
jgi:DNA-binding transcriptional ArsR family regulator